MRCFINRLCVVFFAAAVLAEGGFAQKPVTWQEVRQRFEAANPTLRAGQIGIDESKAQEITAFLRPNPNFTLSTDGSQLARYHGVWQPLAGTQFSTNFSYLHERQRKRDLRLESAQKATRIATSTQEDLERNLEESSGNLW
jgi:cobalt-zinc-cadmium efflux system outer membrane protein